MIDAVTVAAASMSDDMLRLSAISHNLANVTTPGFKRDVVVAQNGFDRALGLMPLAPGNSHIVSDHRHASLRATGNALDVALEGDGFFELLGPTGPLFTRQGDFRLDTVGRLVSSTGLAVQGSAGEILLTSSQPRIERDGRIYDGDKPLGQLRVVDFDDPRTLLKVGSGLYATADGSPVEKAEARVRQGHLENSNVTSTNEMVGLIETMRHFESNQKIIQSYDEMLERAIRTLGDF